jgi:hypothetical protein
LRASAPPTPTARPASSPRASVTGSPVDDEAVGTAAGCTTRTATGGTTPGVAGRSSSSTSPVNTSPTVLAIAATCSGERPVTATSMSTESRVLVAVICWATSSGVPVRPSSWITSRLTRVLLTSST